MILKLSPRCKADKKKVEDAIAIASRDRNRKISEISDSDNEYDYDVDKNGKFEVKEERNL